MSRAVRVEKKAQLILARLPATPTARLQYMLEVFPTATEMREWKWKPRARALTTRIQRAIRAEIRTRGGRR